MIEVGLYPDGNISNLSGEVWGDYSGIIRGRVKNTDRNSNPKPPNLQTLPRRHIIKLSEILQPCVFSQIGHGLRLLEAMARAFVVSVVIMPHPLESPGRENNLH